MKITPVEENVFKHIFALDSVLDDIYEILNKHNADIQKFNTYFRNTLQVIDKNISFKREPHYIKGKFEKIKSSKKKLCKIHYNKKCNLRIICHYSNDDCFYLLYAFYEKETSDYDRAIRTAESRIHFCIFKEEQL